jgi:phosphoesterase RecJ-like protein
MNNVTISDLKKIISNRKKILIISHYNPDGDAIGSSFGLANYFESIGIEAHVYNRDEVPVYLNFLVTKNFHNSVKTIPDNIDLYVLLDFNDLERSGAEMMVYLQKILNNKKPALVIDHHENNKIKLANLFIDSKASSTGILIYRLLSQLKKKINSDVATCLLTTIITDTSSFKNSNSNIESFTVSSNLLDLGANLELINKNIFRLGGINKLILRNKIHSTLRHDSDLKLAICYATSSFYSDTNTTKEDSEGIPNGLIFYDDIEIGIFIREIGKDSWKVSTRTNNFIDLAKFCNIFDGGGHKNAAGFSYNGKLENLIESIISNLKK